MWHNLCPGMMLGRLDQSFIFPSAQFVDPRLCATLVNGVACTADSPVTPASFRHYSEGKDSSNPASAKSSTSAGTSAGSMKAAGSKLQVLGVHGYMQDSTVRAYTMMTLNVGHLPL